MDEITLIVVVYVSIFFLHNAPNIESTHSKKIPTDLHNDVFERMIDGRHYKYQKFCGASAPIEKELKKGYLDDSLVCLKCKRFVCKKRQTTRGKLPESNLELEAIEHSSDVNALSSPKNNTTHLGGVIFCCTGIERP